MLKLNFQVCGNICKAVTRLRKSGPRTLGYPCSVELLAFEGSYPILFAGAEQSRTVKTCVAYDNMSFQPRSQLFVNGVPLRGRANNLFINAVYGEVNAIEVVLWVDQKLP